jgi:hypothetical protein
MENLNAEQVKKDLQKIVDNYSGGWTRFNILSNALALINKQETEYNELYELCESYRIENESVRHRMQHLCQSKFIASFDEVDRKTKEYKRDIAEADILTEVNKQYQTENMVLSAVVEGLTEENERLRAEKEHNAGNEKYILSTVMVAPIDYTVRKMQKSLHERFGYDKNRVHTDYNVHRYIDQIAKEMLEGENEN